MWLQCCQAKLLPSGVARWSPSIHTPHGQVLHERISEMFRVPSGVTRLLGVPRLSSATEWPASSPAPARLPGHRLVRLDHRVGQVRGHRGDRRAEVAAGHDQHRQVARAAHVRAGREGVRAGPGGRHPERRRAAARRARPRSARPWPAPRR